jgi:hypothetical protein
MNADEATTLRAQRVVLGVVKAWQTNAPDDAALMINAYLEEETRTGRSVGSAWALLFSAATVWLAALIESDAVHHHTTAGLRLTELALAHAAETT